MEPGIADALAILFGSESFIAPLPARVCRDPDDDEVLALALTAQVDLIVSGDNDLLDLHAFERIPIVIPADALRRVEAQK